MSGMVSGPGPASDEPARAKKEARNSAIVAAGSFVLAAVVWLAWWRAQVEHVTGPRRGFHEGDPFPWFLVYPMIGVGLWFTVTAIRERAASSRLKGPRG
ncbi:hypothetical protein [Myceligenerans crystallogenes]|uniref:DNA-binding transcriptional regulator of glucitol operon n=1 Tax=Myceligenerans crystallogenes TaxID=316335 RepID=A0ABP4ZG38_9MICO